jgi:hypothetical protein
MDKVGYAEAAAGSEGAASPFYMVQKQAQRLPPGLPDNQLPTGDDEIGKLTLGFEANSPGGKRNGHPISPSSATLTDRQKLWLRFQTVHKSAPSTENVTMAIRLPRS